VSQYHAPSINSLTVEIFIMGDNGASDPPAFSSSAIEATASTQDPKQTTLSNDTGARKPRDARLIHLVLASMNVTAYQERIPLMLMDFAYRYTSGALQDALMFSDAINGTANTGSQNPPSAISSDDLRMSLACRVNHQFNTSLPKEFLLDIAQERNRVALPTVGPEFGVRLPPEKYCLTGVNWTLKGGDVDDDKEEGEDIAIVGQVMGTGGGGNVDSKTDEDDKMDVENLFGDADSSMADA
jgi:transcription initiation factor TFIID subunit 9B